VCFAVSKVISFIKAFVTAGILFIPNAFHNGGIAYSTGTLFVIAVFTCLSMVHLIETKAAIVRDTHCDFDACDFGAIARVATGRIGFHVVNISICACQMAFCIVYVCFVGTTMGNVAPILSTNEWMILCTAVCMPLTLLNDMSSLKGTNLYGVVVIIITILVCFGDAMAQVNHPIPGTPKAEVIWSINPTSFGVFFGTAVYTFEGITLVLPIQANMKEPEKIYGVIYGCLIFLFVLISSFGIVCYAAYGDKTEDIILHNLVEGCDDAHLCVAFHTSLQAVYCTVAVCTFPLQMFPLRVITEKVLFQRENQAWVGCDGMRSTWRCILCLICLGTALLAADNIGMFVALVGSFTCAPLAFIFPGLFHLRIVVQKVHLDVEADRSGPGRSPVHSAQKSPESSYSSSGPDEINIGHGTENREGGDEVPGWKVFVDYVLLFGGTFSSLYCMRDAVLQWIETSTL